VVKKRSEGNHRFRLQASLLFPQGQKKKKDGEKMKMQLMLNVGVVPVCSVKNRTVRNGFDAKGV
jgi:hypothetical protein